MGELGAFLKISRHGAIERPADQRVADYREFVLQRPDAELRDQGARCMECGVPFCHNGCPLGNLIPDWNDLVYRDRWQDAIRQLHATNNFPDFTGRLCPAPCEAACVLEINEGDAVTIKQIEAAIINRAWDEGWVVPQPPKVETGRSVAVVGSGPAGMAAAQQLRRAGHRVVLFERDESIGGLVRFGVPDFKIDKRVVERRVGQLTGEGVELRVGVDVGVDVTIDELRADFDAIVLATGSRVPRDLPIPGRELDGVHFAMDYLYGRNRWVASTDPTQPEPLGSVDPELIAPITARDKHVIVIGGGDTGADCVGNSLREGAKSVTQIEILDRPPDRRPDDQTPWPLWPLKYRRSYAIAEGEALQTAEQDYAVATTHFSGTGTAGEAGGRGRVTKVHFAQAENFAPIPGTEGEWDADLVLLAMGFLHPEQPLLDHIGVAKDQRGNVKAPAYITSEPDVFVAGDARRGQSLIVWAINEGRQCARMVDRYLAQITSPATVREPIHAGNVEPADEGPEGPPLHAQGGLLAAEER
ncbi:glutamate synthase subunit beta [Capillimicrobium parvum]|uniref:Glutamate synthase [NADPH] small chain n=1 Tax=Capillimicrobium parvum TaxID=2884022 RepID=A0A9E6Y0R4_9ACTN|nr:glutamate synthase subunit beta [Capillimicrobium parvum]UGS37825.1 Glutamate synthase [NADPH] small chain [Capillimicrobium parvum]